MGGSTCRARFFALLLLSFCSTFLFVQVRHRFSASTPVASVTDQTVKSQAFPVLTIGDRSPAVTTLHEFLARLGYLPVNFQPISPIEEMFGISPTAPSAGTWQWRYENSPVELKKLWDPTLFTPITRGAVMTFETEHHLPIDGFAGPKVFHSLETALAANIHCEHAYTHVLVKQEVPQTLIVWQAGKEVFTTPCSTGVETASTHTGTHVIYLRNRKQTMEGDTPSGGHYSVDNVPYVSFFYKGEAIHGLQRARYGIPQSVGCVELPIDKAKRVWKLTDYGTLVTIR